MKKILVASDGSQSAERATVFGAKLASSDHAELTILTVIPNTIDTELREIPNTIDKQLREFAEIEGVLAGDVLENDASAILIHAKQVASEFGLLDVKTLVRMGDPAEVILKVASELSPDLIVVGKRGRGRIEGLLHGSVSQKILSLAHYPVLSVP